MRRARDGYQSGSHGNLQRADGLRVNPRLRDIYRDWPWRDSRMREPSPTMRPTTSRFSHQPEEPSQPAPHLLRRSQPAAESAALSPLASNYVWTFTTGASTNTTAPLVTSTNPVDTSIGAGTNQKITATFSEAMDSTTITPTTFTLIGPGRNADCRHGDLLYDRYHRDVHAQQRAHTRHYLHCGYHDRGDRFVG